ncbi:MAG: hypothetical protein QF360_08545 [Phycisphaerales bacterium]|nr:hypothetical protein [Phycisphaerales bacterium]
MRITAWPWGYRSLATLCLAAMAGAGGCRSIDRTHEEYRSIATKTLVVLAGTSLGELDAQQAYLEHKARQGWVVTWVDLPESSDAQQDLQNVRETLKAHQPEQGAAFVLLIGGPASIPMGPWRIDGVEEPIWSDLPLLMHGVAAPRIGECIDARMVEEMFQKPPRWCVGRIPYDDPRLVDRILRTSIRFDEVDDREPVAMLTAPRMGAPHIISMIMDEAREHLESAGFDATLYGEDTPRDQKLPTEQVPFGFIAGEHDVACFVRHGFQLTMVARPVAAGSVSSEARSDLDTPAAQSMTESGYIPASTLEAAKLSLAAIARRLQARYMKAHAPDVIKPECHATLKHVGAAFTATLVPIDVPNADASGVDISQATLVLAPEGLTEMFLTPKGIASLWRERSPRLVYSVAHGGRLPSNTDGVASMLDGTISTPAMFTLAIDDCVEEHGGEVVQGSPLTIPTPESPAIFASTGCQLAAPGDPLIEQLFRSGWIAAYCGSTEINEPNPLIPSIRAESNAAAFMASGLPIALAGHATLRHYLAESRSDPSLYLMPGSREGMLTNLASYTVLGDPTLVLPLSREAVPTSD